MSTLFDQGAAIAGFVQVAPEQGIDLSGGVLTYALPEALKDVRVGQRVMVPLGRGNKPVSGYVVSLRHQGKVDMKRIKQVLGRDPHSISLPSALIELARWMAGYYCCPLGMVLQTMLPAAVKRGTGTSVRTDVRIAATEKEIQAATDATPSAEAATEPSDSADGKPKPRRKLTPLQQKVLDCARQRLDAGQPWIDMKHLADLAGAKTVSSVKQLIDRQLLDVRREEQVVSDFDIRAMQQAEPVRDVQLNPSQQQALEHLIHHLHVEPERGFSVHLIHGVTGSGKTEVYLRFLQHVMSNGRTTPRVDEDHAQVMSPGIIILVPEIALTPQTVARFIARFDHVAVLHSGLTQAQRHAQWRLIREGKANVVVGARSAVFAPVANLRLIIVDEEHESSYKQDQLPRYHARDVAIRRAQLSQIPIVLGSATPSLESYFNAIGRKLPDEGEAHATAVSSSSSPSSLSHYHLIELPERVAGLKMPEVELVDLTQERRKRYEYTGKAGVHLLSIRMEKLLQQTLKGGGQAILLLNRRGYANYLACPDHRCGWMMNCNHCDTTMVYHKDANIPAGGYVQCHHCHAEQLLPPLCPQCSKRVTIFGLGTQRVEEELQRKLPDARFARMDSDTMRRAGDYQETLDQFRCGELNVLLGTQMIAKGLDFPGVRLVGVISGDTSLHMPDFRAAERTFQLIAQVAGRAGRGEHPGRVIVQTFNINDPTIQLAAKHDYTRFAMRELRLRQQVGLPPITRMARVVIRHQDHVKCVQQARELFTHMAHFNGQLPQPVRLRGPMPCAIARIADYHRQQIELIAPTPGVIQQLLTHLRNHRLLVSDRNHAVDVDPVTML